MAGNVHKLVQKTEPEVVQAVISQSHANHRGTIRQEHGRTIEVSVRQVSSDDEDDAMFCEELLRLLRTVPARAELCHLAQKHRGNSPPTVLPPQLRSTRLGKHIRAPGGQGIAIHL